jgi:hypothetical protein
MDKLKIVIVQRWIYLLFYFLDICFRISFVVLVNYCLFELFTPFITRDVNGMDNLLPKSAFVSVFEDMICTLEILRIWMRMGIWVKRIPDGYNNGYGNLYPLKTLHLRSPI